MKNKRGTLSMARTNDINSATSQFFVNLKDNDFLDHKPGLVRLRRVRQVTEGMDVVDKIAAVKTGRRKGYDDVPLEDVVITSRQRARRCCVRLFRVDRARGPAPSSCSRRLPVLVMRWLDPPTSAFMLRAQLMRPRRLSHALPLGRPEQHLAARRARGDRGRRPAVSVPRRLRPEIDPRGRARERASQAPARREHHHAAGGEEPVPVERRELRAQGTGGVVHGADRGAAGRSSASSRCISTSRSSGAACTASKPPRGDSSASPPRASRDTKRPRSRPCCRIRAACARTAPHATSPSGGTGS